jgi:putative acetyltransferase
MIKVVRTVSSNIEFIGLVKILDADLKLRDGEEHSFYAQFNKVDLIKHVVVLYFDEVAVGCGAIKKYDEDIVEIKRMFVNPEYRNKGIATEILLELEQWAKELAYKTLILETGIKQPEAIALYKKNGYSIIPNYGQYEGVENSVCFTKII